jgi:hypothetical protein
MLYLALLPLLAMSGTMAGPMMRRGRGYRMPSSLNENNRQLFLVLTPTTNPKVPPEWQAFLVVCLTQFLLMR